MSIIIRVSRRQRHEIDCVNGGITGDVLKAMMMEASRMMKRIISGAIAIRYMVTCTGCEVGYMGFIRSAAGMKWTSIECDVVAAGSGDGGSRIRQYDSVMVRCFRIKPASVQIAGMAMDVDCADRSR